MTPFTFFNRRWWWVTPIVIVGVIVLVRLGIWQIDRLEQRRTFNNMVYTRWIEEPYDITAGALPDDIYELEYRRVQVSGEYDYENQIALKNQKRGEEAGINLVTPLVLDDGRAVLVARGWIPQRDASPEAWVQYEEPSDEPIVGLIQESQLMPFDKPVPIPEAPEQEWFYVNVEAIQPQMPYELLPIFVLQLPDAERGFNDLPYREEPLRLHEGSHLSYAVQWFSFALILGFGYILFVRHHELKLKHKEVGKSEADDDHETDLTPAHQA